MARQRNVKLIATSALTRSLTWSRQHVVGVFLAAAYIIVAPAAHAQNSDSAEPRSQPGTLANGGEGANGSANGHVLVPGAGAASAIEPVASFIAPNPAAGISLKSYLTAREMATYEARQVWNGKLFEADVKGFQWGPAIAQSAFILAISHTYRIADQPDTREHLKGPFVKDWINSVKGLSGWGDTDGYLANYIAHPFQGAVTGYFQIQNDPRGRLQEFGKSPVYWKSRMKAFAWAAVYSTIYELSPVGDGAIGNVGHPQHNPGTKGAVDLVVTPTLGLGLILLQDFVDMKVVWPLEQRVNNRIVIRALRSWLGMHRSFANLLRFKRPWYIDSRGPVGSPIRYSQLPAAY